MNVGSGRQGGSFGQQGPPNSPRGQGGNILSSIGKVIGSNANLLPLLTSFVGNKGGGGTANPLGSLASIVGMMNNNAAANNPLSGLAGMMGNMNNTAANPLSALAGMMGNMNNTAAANPLSALAGMMNNNSNNSSGFKNSPGQQMPNLDPNELLAKLSAMMNSTGTGSNSNEDDIRADHVIDTEENPQGSFSARKPEGENNYTNNNENSGLNMESLSALWPLISGLFNNDNNPKNSYNDSASPNSNNNSQGTSQAPTPEKSYFDLADRENEPYLACFNCLHPCYRRQISLPSFQEVREMAEGWSRY